MVRERMTPAQHEREVFWTLGPAELLGAVADWLRELASAPEEVEYSAEITGCDLVFADQFTGNDVTDRVRVRALLEATVAAMPFLEGDAGRAPEILVRLVLDREDRIRATLEGQPVELDAVTYPAALRALADKLDARG
jgi:hypothetical protein